MPKRKLSKAKKIGRIEKGIRKCKLCTPWKTHNDHNYCGNSKLDQGSFNEDNAPKKQNLQNVDSSPCIEESEVTGAEVCSPCIDESEVTGAEVRSAEKVTVLQDGHFMYHTDEQFVLNVVPQCGKVQYRLSKEAVYSSGPESEEIRNLSKILSSIPTKPSIIDLSSINQLRSIKESNDEIKAIVYYEDECEEVRPAINNVDEYYEFRPIINNQDQFDEIRPAINNQYQHDEIRPAINNQYQDDEIRPVINNQYQDDEIIPVINNQYQDDEIRPVINNQDLYDEIRPVINNQYQDDEIRPVINNQYQDDEIRPVINNQDQDDEIRPVINNQYQDDEMRPVINNQDQDDEIRTVINNQYNDINDGDQVQTTYKLTSVENDHEADDQDESDEVKPLIKITPASDKSEKSSERCTVARNERKRSQDSQSSDGGPPKRSRLDKVIGELGSQIGISPETIKCDSSDENSRQCSDTSEKSEDNLSSLSDEEDDKISHSSTKTVWISGKELDALVRRKVSTYLKTHRDSKIENLEAANEMLQSQARRLHWQVFHLTEILQQTLEEKRISFSVKVAKIPPTAADPATNMTITAPLLSNTVTTGTTSSTSLQGVVRTTTQVPSNTAPLLSSTDTMKTSSSNSLQGVVMTTTQVPSNTAPLLSSTDTMKTSSSNSLQGVVMTSTQVPSITVPLLSSNITTGVMTTTQVPSNTAPIPSKTVTTETTSSTSLHDVVMTTTQVPSNTAPLLSNTVTTETTGSNSLQGVVMMTQQQEESFCGQSQEDTQQQTVIKPTQGIPSKRASKPNTKFGTSVYTLNLPQSDSEEKTEPDQSSSSTCVIRRGKYKVHTLAEKREAVQLSYELGTPTVERRLNIAHSTLMTWRRALSEDSPKVERNLTSGRKIGSGRKLSYGDAVDQKILTWIYEQRDLQLPVSSQRVRTYAKQTVADEGFKASGGWLCRFCKRHQLSLRMKTHQAQRLPEELMKRINVFYNQIRELQGDIVDKNFIINMDETLCNLDWIPSKMSGPVSVEVRRRMTVVLAATASGKTLPPMVIFKGKTPLQEEAVRVQARVQAKGLMDREVMKDWLHNVIKPYTQGRPCLLVLDAFSEHQTEEVRALMSQLSVTPVFIPAGCTSKVQPLNVSITGPFKLMMSKMWAAYMEEHIPESSEHFTKTVSKTQVLEWVNNAWTKISEKSSMIKRSFIVSGIVREAPDVTIAWLEGQSLNDAGLALGEDLEGSEDEDNFEGFLVDDNAVECHSDSDSFDDT